MRDDNRDELIELELTEHCQLSDEKRNRYSFSDKQQLVSRCEITQFYLEQDVTFMRVLAACECCSLQCCKEKSDVGDTITAAYLRQDQPVAFFFFYVILLFAH